MLQMDMETVATELDHQAPVTEPEVAAVQTPEGLQVLDLTTLAAQQEQGESSGEEDDKHESRLPREAKTGPPSLDEWQDFLGAIVLRGLTEGYLQITLFRVIEESDLTDREKQLIRLTKEDLRDMAAPMASYANKNKFARKHGRSVIAAASSCEALIDLFIWMKRVNKITRRHAAAKKPQDNQEVRNDGQVSATDSENANRPAVGGIVAGPVIRGTGG
jgi:hypothetical protein